MTTGLLRCAAFSDFESYPDAQPPECLDISHVVGRQVHSIDLRCLPMTLALSSFFVATGAIVHHTPFSFSGLALSLLHQIYLHQDFVVSCHDDIPIHCQVSVPMLCDRRTRPLCTEPDVRCARGTTRNCLGKMDPMFVCNLLCQKQASTWLPVPPPMRSRSKLQAGEDWISTNHKAIV